MILIRDRNDVFTLQMKNIIFFRDGIHRDVFDEIPSMCKIPSQKLSSQCKIPSFFSFLKINIIM